MLLRDDTAERKAQAQIIEQQRSLAAPVKVAEADGCLTGLGEMTLAAEVDVREYILGARTLHAGGTSFFETLGQYMERFGQLYGLRAQMTVPDALAAQGLGESTETQLLRVVQEALSNIRKHA